MIQTQVQLPDALYLEAQRISSQYEMSLEEVVRRGLEGIIPAYPNRVPGNDSWTLPTVHLQLKQDPFANEDWREEHSSNAILKVE